MGAVAYKTRICALALALLIAAAAFFAVPPYAHAGLGAPASSVDYASREMLDADALVPVTPDMVKDGTYKIAVRSDSSLFRIVECELTVKDGAMSVVMTLGGHGYKYLYPGTGNEAYQKDESTYAGYTVNPETGQYSYKLPINALNVAFDITALSKRKDLWYDHQVIFLAASLPTSALTDAGLRAVQESSKVKGFPNGVYTCTATLSGGSGRASLSDPCQVTLKDGIGVARIEWSSQYYDYMIVGSTKYYPVNNGGDSVFEIPITAFDVPIAVVADTTALSQPYEIEYQITFWSSSLQQKSSTNGPGLPVVIVVVIVFALGYGAVVIASRRTHRTARERRK